MQSSPSKAGSLAPLLRRQLSGGQRSPLVKFPSGLSGVSSHDNPMYDEPSDGGGWSGQGGTQQSVLPQQMGSWELQSAFAQAQAAAAAEAGSEAQQTQQQQDSEELWRPDIIAMMESKGATGGTGGRTVRLLNWSPDQNKHASSLFFPLI